MDEKKFVVMDCLVTDCKWNNVLSCTWCTSKENTEGEPLLIELNHKGQPVCTNYKKRNPLHRVK